MSRDGYLPDNVRECDVPGNRPQDNHDERCPCHDDSDPICVCRCPDDKHDERGICRDEKRCLCEGWKHDEDPDCICADLDSDAKADAAEAIIERDREGF